MIKFSDLDQQQIDKISEAFAKRDKFDGARYVCNSCAMPEYIDYFYAGESSCPACGAKVRPNRLDYPTDLNAMHRIIVGMDEYELSKYACRLSELYECPEHEHTMAFTLRLALQCTAQQQFVAAAMALGLIAERERQ